MKIIVKIRDLILYNLWFQIFIAFFLTFSSPYLFQKIGSPLKPQHELYVVVGFALLLSLIAYKLIGIEYTNKIKVYFPKRKKWRIVEIIMFLSVAILFSTILVDWDLPGMNWIYISSFSIFILTFLYLISIPSNKRENKLARLILTKTKIIIYKGFRKPQKEEFDLNNLSISLESENQLKLIATGEQQESTSIDLNELKEKDRMELLEILLK